MKAFRSKELNTIVLDSKCVCGHLESEHGSHTKKVAGKLLRDANAGSCCCGTCACSRFTWDAFVTIEDLEIRMKPAKVLH